MPFFVRQLIHCASSSLAVKSCHKRFEHIVIPVHKEGSSSGWEHFWRIAHAPASPCPFGKMAMRGHAFPKVLFPLRCSRPTVMASVNVLLNEWIIKPKSNIYHNIKKHKNNRIKTQDKREKLFFLLVDAMCQGGMAVMNEFFFTCKDTGNGVESVETPRRKHGFLKIKTITNRWTAEPEAQDGCFRSRWGKACHEAAS